MKRTIITLFAALFAATALWAQTPDEILARMDKEVARFDKEGVNMIMDIKIPLLGTYSTDMHILGDMYKATLNVRNETSITWSDGITTWDYDSSDNELTITPAKPKEGTEAQDNMKLLDGVTEGYDVKLKKETAEAWEFVCTKSKTNPNKDDPKKIFSPFSLSFFNKNDSLKEEYSNFNSNERIIKEKENENKLFKMINFDYNNYEFNEELLFHICHGFVDPDKLKEENILGNQPKTNIMKNAGENLNLIKKVEEKKEKDNSVSSNKSNINLKLEEEKQDIKDRMIINDLIEEINIIIQKKEKLEFFKEEINNYNESKKKLEENLKASNKEKKKFYQDWVDKFHEIEVIYNNYRVQIERTETIRRNREEKKKLEEEKKKQDKINEERKLMNELEKIRQKALQKKYNEERGIYNNSSIFSDSQMTFSSGNAGSSFSSNMKGTNSSKISNNNGKKSKKRKDKKHERLDWMVKKSDNFFDQY